jgi:hypothetical protein
MNLCIAGSFASVIAKLDLTDVVGSISTCLFLFVMPRDRRQCAGNDRVQTKS